MIVKLEGLFEGPLYLSVMAGKSAKRVFALDVPAIHVFLT
jgi:hypothetical protein